ncbi:hypothetical protein H2O73_04840 [Vibrio sp. 404]|uniref:Uncharacterized protein n=1 Tax=Vibrio marinisediminis TaxID=2758441 RepID=A0A7W2FPC5_9VIBR|nr:hypothetical protein [Vibrio marinisediminis]MBA5761667.1 hypothetical protein [Vibrio marinisediminis]
MQKIVKVSELKNLLDTMTTDTDLDVVTGDEWLPEQLVATSIVEDMLFLEFDNAPEDIQGEEARGFVEHEIDMIRGKFEQIIAEDSDAKSKADAILALFLLGHELSSGEVIEILEDSENAFSEKPEEACEAEPV